MKKVVLLMGSLLFVFLVGCSQYKVEKAKSLEESYFKIVEKSSKNEEINKIYLNQLLSGYEYVKDKKFRVEGENDDGSDYIQQPYIFEHENEKLTLTHSNFNNKEHIEPMYSIINNGEETTISYLESDPEFESKEDKKRNDFIFTTMSNDIKTHQEIAAKLPNNKDKWDKIYKEVSTNIAKNNSISIETIKNLIGEKPSIQEYQDTLNSSINLNLKEYVFENNDETLMIKYLKDKNKIWEIFYNDKESGTIKTTIDKKLLNPKEKLYTGIITYVNTIDIQRELLYKAIKKV